MRTTVRQTDVATSDESGPEPADDIDMAEGSFNRPGADIAIARRIASGGCRLCRDTVTAGATAFA